MEHFCMQSVKKVLFERLCVLIYLHPIAEDVAIPHPPLRGTFPPGEVLASPNSQFVGLLRKTDKHILLFLRQRTQKKSSCLLIILPGQGTDFLRRQDPLPGIDFPGICAPTQKLVDLINRI